MYTASSTAPAQDALRSYERQQDSLIQVAQHRHGSLEYIVASLREAVAQSKEQVPAGNKFHAVTYDRYGYLIAAAREAAELLETYRCNLPKEPPIPNGEAVTVEINIPVNHLSVENFKTFSHEHRSDEIEVAHAELIDEIKLPAGWEINDIDLDQDALRKHLIEQINS
ncbi:hypothetical protein FIU95_13710 [Microbulbifer sp. THAF38]|nr:hypothetical protein FIU95_13710 [Microbulbifer sp. THAF38]